MTPFDPFGLLEKHISAKTLHRLIRAGIITVLIALLFHRISVWEQYFFKPLWAAEAIVYAVFLFSYIIRQDPVQRSYGAREILIPLAGGMLPFALLFSPPHPLIIGNIASAYAVFIWMTTATLFTVWGLWALRRSFSITVEARALVTSGPYRFVRHPVYLGEMLTAAAVVCLRFSWIDVMIFALFAAVQLYRAKMEEQKLWRVFPAYADFARKSLWFWHFRPIT